MKIPYRPELDGLRAIAVLAVMVYHAKINIGGEPFFKGGFVGVDVFFVLSGFFITSIILQEIRLERFSIANFYERRARRILPAFLVMLLISSIFAWFVLLPEQLVSFSGSGLFSLAFGANYWFWSEDSYTAESSIYKPLLHTWSLGVEEQFYLFFPIVIIFVWKKYRDYLLQVLCIVFIISLALAQYQSRTAPDSAFYLLGSRVWELLTGAVIAHRLLSGSRMQRVLYSNAFSLLGLGMIIISMFVFDENTPHPSLYTLLPVFGTALIIYFGGNGDLVSKVLSLKPFVWMGLISFSAYLWHSPFLAFYRTFIIEVTNYEIVVILIVVILLSVLSYCFLEKPFRNIEKVSRSGLVIFVFTAVASLVIMNTYMFTNKGVPERFGEMQDLFKEINGNRIFKQDESVCNNRGLDNACSFIRKKDNPELLLVGDSHAGAIAKSINTIAEKMDLSFKLYSVDGCTNLAGISHYYEHKGEIRSNEDCNSESQKIYDHLLSIPPAVVIYSVRLQRYLNQTPFDNGEGGVEDGLKLIVESESDSVSSRDQVSRSIQKWINYGHAVVLVYPVPEVGVDVPKVIRSKLFRTERENWLQRLKTEPVTTNYSLYKERTASAFEAYNDITGAMVYRVYPETVFCSKESQRCMTHNSTELFYHDDDHLSLQGADKLGGIISPKVELALRALEEAR